MAMLPKLLALAAALPSVALAQADEVVVIERDTLLFGQVFGEIELSRALARDAAGLWLAVMPEGSRSARYSRAALARSARTQMPVLARWLPANSQGTITVISRAAAPRDDRRDRRECVRIEAPIAMDEPVLAADVADAACPDAAPPPAFRHSSSGVRARRALAAGEVVVSPGVSLFTDVRAGQSIVLTVDIGHIRVRREVETVTGGRHGRRVFVRRGLGEPFAVELHPEEVR